MNTPPNPFNTQAKARTHLATDSKAETVASPMDPLVYSQIEDALDRAEVPHTDRNGRWLPLAERVNWLIAQPPAEAQPVAWAEKDGDEWIVYDADSDTGQHILNYQKDRHFRSVFPIYAHPPPSAPVGVRNAILDALNLVHAEGRARVESATAEMADRLAALVKQQGGRDGSS